MYSVGEPILPVSIRGSGEALGGLARLFGSGGGVTQRHTFIWADIVEAMPEAASRSGQVRSPPQEQGGHLVAPGQSRRGEPVPDASECRRSGSRTIAAGVVDQTETQPGEHAVQRRRDECVVLGGQSLHRRSDRRDAFIDQRVGYNGILRNHGPVSRCRRNVGGMPGDRLRDGLLHALGRSGRLLPGTGGSSFGMAGRSSASSRPRCGASPASDGRPGPQPPEAAHSQPRRRLPRGPASFRLRVMPSRSAPRRRPPGRRTNAGAPLRRGRRPPPSRRSGSPPGSWKSGPASMSPSGRRRRDVQALHRAG